MRFAIAALLFPILFVTATQAAAQHRLGQNHTAQGALRLGGFNDESLSTGYLFGDFTLSWARQDWSVNLGAFGVVGRRHETYFDLSYQTSYGRLIVGFPRPAYDLVALSRITDITPRLALEDIGVSRSRATYGTMNQTKYLPYGVVFTQQSDTWVLAGSLHGVPDYDTEIAGLAAAYTQGPTTYAAAVEAVSQDADLLWNWKAQIENAQDWGTISVSAFDGAANAADATLELGISGAVSAYATIQCAARYNEAQEWLVQAGGHVDLNKAVGLSGSIGHSTGQDSIDLAISYRF
ncbi:MAG: hypothetical protein NWQ23_02630 [Yoonia sp.]|uniref:hypothetical protein n=1 Tax=Yoonia sp. TaxID=2212373 RepID=UPI00273E3D4B|nr:hypothetical protein [Yoonia sp.]MDP5084289.1 hypothetical protein [Yoonia sp.]